MQPFDVNGPWVRWSRYELVNGAVFPAPGAELHEYDPWQVFRSNVGKYRTVEQPYISVLELHRHLERAASRGIHPSRPASRHVLGEPIVGAKNEADDLILNWCNKNGLLGLLPVLCNSIRIPLSVEPGRDDCERVVKRVHRFRDGGIWTNEIVTSALSSSTAEDAEAKVRRIAQEAPKPRATWFDWLTHTYEDKPLAHIRHFFLLSPFGVPDPEGVFIPPQPGTREFWERYGEPVKEMTQWCQIFSRAVSYMSRWEGETTTPDEQAILAVQQAHWALGGLAQACPYSFRFNPARNYISEERASAGLLASFALMFLWDRMEGRRALLCGNCGKNFVSDERRAQYCSPRCRNTAQSRRYRHSVRRALKSER